MRAVFILLCVAATVSHAHDAHGHSTPPPEARLLKSPIPVTDAQAAAAQPAYDRLCAGCHGADGKARTAIAGKLPMRPTNLTEYPMESMRDGEIFWVIGTMHRAEHARLCRSTRRDATLAGCAVCPPASAPPKKRGEGKARAL